MTGWCLTCRAPRSTPGHAPLRDYRCPVCGGDLHGTSSKALEPLRRARREPGPDDWIEAERRPTAP